MSTALWVIIGIAAVIVGAVTTLGKNVSSTFDTIATKMSAATATSTTTQ